MSIVLLGLHQSHVIRNNYLIYCHLCKESLLCKEFQTHLLEKHNDAYDNRHSCQWCLGAYSWPAYTKAMHVNHLEACYKFYWRNHLFRELPEPQPVSRTTLLQYLDSVKSKKSLIYCDYCGVHLMCDELRRHLLNMHSDVYKNPNSCHWCGGAYVFPLETKYRHLDHLQQCFDCYYENHELVYNATYPIALSADWISQYEKRVFDLTNTVAESTGVMRYDRRRYRRLGKKLKKHFDIQIVDSMCGDILINPLFIQEGIPTDNYSVSDEDSSSSSDSFSNDCLI